MCRERDESITHLISEYKQLSQKEYKQRNDNIARIIHLDLSKALAQLARLSDIIARIELKEKLDNYSELDRKSKKIWNFSQVLVVPVVIGAQGVTSKRLKNWLKKFSVKSSIDLLQKIALLGTGKVVRQFLET